MFYQGKTYVLNSQKKILASSAAVLGVFSLNQNIAAEPVKEQSKKDNSEKFDFVVIGAGAAGLAAAIEAKTGWRQYCPTGESSPPRRRQHYVCVRHAFVLSAAVSKKGLGDTLEKFVNDQMHETQAEWGDRDAIEAFCFGVRPSTDWLIDIGTPLKLKKRSPSSKTSSRQFYMTTDGTTGGSHFDAQNASRCKENWSSNSCQYKKPTNYNY